MNHRSNEDTNEVEAVVAPPDDPLHAGQNNARGNITSFDPVLAVLYIVICGSFLLLLAWAWRLL